MNLSVIESSLIASSHIVWCVFVFIVQASVAVLHAKTFKLFALVYVSIQDMNNLCNMQIWPNVGLQSNGILCKTLAAHWMIQFRPFVLSLHCIIWRACVYIRLAEREEEVPRFWWCAMAHLNLFHFRMHYNQFILAHLRASGWAAKIWNSSVYNVVFFRFCFSFQVPIKPKYECIASKCINRTIAGKGQQWR